MEVVVNLPWVARSTLEAVVEERDRLRAQVDRLIEHHSRLDRVEAGLTEHPAPPPPPNEPMPEEVVALINRWDSPAIRSRLEQDARRAYGNWRDWDRVARFLDGEPE